MKTSLRIQCYDRDLKAAREAVSEGREVEAKETKCRRSEATT